MNQVVTGEDFSEADCLAVGAQLLNGQYLIQAPLQSGGFGMTYLACNSLARHVVIKECYPAELCTRQGDMVSAKSPDARQQFDAIKKQFVREARQLATLIHPNIVAVHQVFEENNTAYMALDYIDGADLVTVVEEQRSRITNAFVKATLIQSLTALKFIHDAGLLHRDLAPDNIMVDGKDHFTLIDFGAVQEQSGQNGPCIFAVKDGYSPYEYYIPDAKHGFHSDIYALGATVHYLITGAPPPDSYTRLKALTSGKKDPYVPLASGDWDVDANVLASIDRALKMHRKNRFKSVSDWMNELNATPGQKSKPRKNVGFDPDLEKEIAHIVQTTNTQLEERGPDTAAGRAEAKKRARQLALQQANEQQTIVDIFGNPIEDIDAWQEEQEQEIQSRQKGRVAESSDGEPTYTAHENEMINNNEEAPKSILFGLISRCLPSQNKSNPTDT